MPLPPEAQAAIPPSAEEPESQPYELLSLRRGHQAPYDEGPAACPEDAVISDLVRASGGDIAFEDYQTFAASVPDIEALLRSAPSASPLLHFEGREKPRMKDALGALERLGGVRRAKPRQFTSP